MSGVGASRGKSAAYRCTGCGIKRKGPVGLDSCPDCGATLIRLYAARRRRPPSAKVFGAD